MPVGREVIHGDDDPGEQGRRGKMAKLAMDKGEEVLDGFPEIRLLISQMWTPPGPRASPGPSLSTHMAIVSDEHGLTQEDAMMAVDQFIAALVDFRINLEKDPAAVGVTKRQRRH